MLDTSETYNKDSVLFNVHRTTMETLSVKSVFRNALQINLEIRLLINAFQSAMQWAILLIKSLLRIVLLDVLEGILATLKSKFVLNSVLLDSITIQR